MQYLFKFLIIVCLTYVGIYSQLQAQPTIKQWDRAYTGSRNDYLTSMLLVADGGFLLGGRSDSNPAFDKSDSTRGSNDFWIIRTDAQGNRIWDNTFGSTGDDRLTDMLLLPDGGFLLGGYSNSPAAFEKSDSSRGGDDYWVVRTDAQGNKIWDKTLGGSAGDILTKMILLPNGDFLLGGRSNSNISSEKSENIRGGDDFWIVRIDAQGNKIWDKTLGGSSGESLTDMLLLPDGGFLLGGNSNSNISFEKSQNRKGGTDFWVIRTDAQGNKVWDKTLGFIHSDVLTSLLLLPDGNVLLGGHTQGNVPFNDDPFLPLLIKIDLQGTLIWEKVLNYCSGCGTELFDMDLLPDGSFLLNGFIRALGENWTIRTDDAGNIIWNLRLYNAGDAYYGDAILIPGAYLLGRTLVEAGDRRTFSDYWVAKFNLTENFQNQDLDVLLFDARTDKIIQGVQTGDIIDVNTLGTDFLAFVVNDKKRQFESIDLKLEGPINFQKTENVAPYALFGDNLGNDFIGQNFPPGAYTLTITPYTQDQLQGTQGDIMTLTFTVVGEKFTILNRLVLINADTEKDIRDLKNGDVISLNHVGTERLSVRVDPLGNKTKSVKMELSGALTHTQVENIKPFTLFGDQTATQFFGRDFVAGSYTLKVTPYTEANLSGQVGDPLEVNFELTGSGLHVTGLTLVNALTGQDIQPLNNGDKINLDQIGTQFFSIRAENSGNKVGSVRMVLNGAQLNHTQLESYVPFSLFGDNSGQEYYGANFCPGDYSLSVTAYPEKNQGGIQGVTKNIKFQLVDSSSFNIQKLVLFDPATNTDIRVLQEVDTITIGPPYDDFSIRTVVGPCVESVKVSTNGNVPEVDNKAPFYKTYHGLSEDYTLTFTAYSAKNNLGIAGEKITIRLRVEGYLSRPTNPTVKLETDLSEASSWQVFPNPNSAGILHLRFDVKQEHKAQLTLLDNQGKVHLKREINGQEVDLDIQTLKPGFYIIEVQTEQGVLRKTFIKN